MTSLRRRYWIVGLIGICSSPVRMVQFGLQNTLFLGQIFLLSEDVLYYIEPHYILASRSTNILWTMESLVLQAWEGGVIAAFIAWGIQTGQQQMFYAVTI
ncbi:unnamed protein product [Macrosiphum euphorbiae]|uniref:Uncharacterized protein n=1 Tax=Macrosiphum euphorbiae TaxID=13131 RepID=A0AAV0XBZ5_9HEMI|nr:unnamed protein product [Macrosiphum euphorbiae]